MWKIDSEEVVENRVAWCPRFGVEGDRQTTKRCAETQILTEDLCCERRKKGKREKSRQIGARR